MDTLNDVHMSNGKQHINKNLKTNVWFNHFGYNLEGICYYCKNSILIPKLVKEKLHPTLDLDCYEDKITTPIYGTHFDHIVSEYNDGRTTEQNLRPICIMCNLKKSNKNEEDVNFNIENKDEDDFMDIDVKIHKCKGLRKIKNGLSILCKNNSYFRNKCNSHLHQNTKY